MKCTLFWVCVYESVLVFIMTFPENKILEIKINKIGDLIKKDIMINQCFKMPLLKIIHTTTSQAVETKGTGKY